MGPQPALQCALQRRRLQPYFACGWALPKQGTHMFRLAVTNTCYSVVSIYSVMVW